MKVALLFLALIVQVPAAHAQDLVPDAAVRFAQQELEKARLKDVTFKLARIDIGYAIRVVSVGRAIEFLRSDIDNPATFASDGYFPAFTFPILAGDSCVSALSLIRKDDSKTGVSSYDAMWPLEMRDVDPREKALARLHNIFKTDRIWLCEFPWSGIWKTIVVGRLDAPTVVVEVGEALSWKDSSLVASARPMADWARDTKRRLQEYYRLGEPLPPPSHDIPQGAWDAARREVWSITTTIEHPYVQFQLDFMEAALWLESTEPDPTVFDRNPYYCFPIRYRGEYVKILDMGRNEDAMGRSGRPGEGEYSHTGSTRPNNFNDWIDALVQRGDAAIASVPEARYVFHVLGPDGAQMVTPASRFQKERRESVEEFAARVKPDLRRKLLESP